MVYINVDSPYMLFVAPVRKELCREMTEKEQGFLFQREIDVDFFFIRVSGQYQGISI